MQACVSVTHWRVAEQTVGPVLLQVGSIYQAPAMSQIPLCQIQSGLWLQAALGRGQSAQGNVLPLGAWEFHLPACSSLQGKGKPNFSA